MGVGRWGRGVTGAVPWPDAHPLATRTLLGAPLKSDWGAAKVRSPPWYAEGEMVGSGPGWEPRRWWEVLKFLDIFWRKRQWDYGTDWKVEEQRPVEFGPGQAEDGAAILLRQDYIDGEAEVKKFYTIETLGLWVIIVFPTKIYNQKALPPQFGIRNSIHSAPGSKDVFRWLQFAARQPQLTDWGAEHPACCLLPICYGSGQQRLSPWSLRPILHSVPYDPLDLLYVCSKTPFNCHSGNSCKCTVIAWCWDRANDVTKLSLFPQLSQRHQWRRKAVLPGSPRNSERISSFLYPASKFGQLLGNKILLPWRPLINGTGLTIRKERRKSYICMKPRTPRRTS